MIARIIIFILLVSSRVFAQPGPDVIFPTDINLNYYPSFARGMDKDSLAVDMYKPNLGTIIIDSTSDLSIIPLLKKEKNLSLRIDLLKIPSEFEGFRNTKYLRLIHLKDSMDISFINEFKNLESLHLERLGNVIFSNYLILDSLRQLEVSFSERLTSLEAFKKVKSLNRISLSQIPSLKEFPEFDTANRITYVRIHQESGDGCTNCLPNSNKLDLSNLSRLRYLEELDLSNVNGITEIPTDLSKELRVFRMFDVQRANKEYAIRSYINDVSGFSNYENLEIIEISGVHIKEFKGNFEKLKLKNLTLRWVYGLEDISGIFTMNSIDNVRIEKCRIKVIDGLVCRATIGNMVFSGCLRIENIDFLLSCEHIKQLHIEGGKSLLLPKQEEWNIPNLTIYANGKAGKLYVKKRDGVIDESSNLNRYIK